MRNSLIIGFALCTGLGCVSTRTGPFRPASAPVPPTQEIEVLDPGQSSTGVPAVQTVAGTDGTQRVEIPPVVLVHRYYPSGDRSFQAALLPGGPCIIATNHPKTMERTYVNVTLPPGAPRVIYSGKSIVYDYGPQSVTIHFGPCGATVCYSQGIQLVETAHGACEKVSDRVHDLSQRAGIGQGLKRAKEGVNGLAEKGADAIAGLRREPVPSMQDR
jgi:hypothetical protein